MTVSPDPRMYTASPLVGVGVVALRGDRVLLIQRGKPPRQGQWSLPGGMQHLGETVRETAAREALEETGLAVEIKDLLDVIDLIETDPEGKTCRHYTLIDFWGIAPEGDPRAGDDAMDARWFTRAEVDLLPMWEKTREIIALAFSRAAGTRGA
ncbi:NUDIX hydrolase [Pedomonas mirosovicensis]|uniref:NUDIX hydrolase n=1 Tax=Pedomonas mirosovicensis TaxID=2908641 RepID=UPI00216A9945|nr:NUDIX hydrolase [Pedomonas mirosovicensis]MCH8685367.1 NUDIX hydrolase [Pedomonas mirosovicensis]